jgi:hypothetical protein
LSAERLKVVYTPMDLHAQERAIIERWRRMDPERQRAFLSLSKLLDATPAGVPMMAAANDAVAEHGGGLGDRDPLHWDFIAHKAFHDAVNASEKMTDCEMPNSERKL